MVGRSKAGNERIITLELLLKRKRDLDSLRVLIALVYESEHGTSFGRLLELVTMEIIDQLEQI